MIKFKKGWEVINIDYGKNIKKYEYFKRKYHIVVTIDKENIHLACSFDKENMGCLITYSIKEDQLIGYFKRLKEILKYHLIELDDNFFNSFKIVEDDLIKDKGEKR